MAQKSDAAIISMVKESHRLANFALNKDHGPLVDDTHVHALGNALIAGGHVEPRSANGLPSTTNRAGASKKGNDLLDDAFGEAEEKSAGNY